MHSTKKEHALHGLGEGYAVRHSEGVKGGLRGWPVLLVRAKLCCGNAALRMSKESKNGNQMRMVDGNQDAVDQSNVEGRKGFDRPVVCQLFSGTSKIRDWRNRESLKYIDSTYPASH